MNLLERIDRDLKEALRAREALRLSVLRMLKNALQNKAIEKGQDTLSETEGFETVSKLIKQRRESVEAFRKGGRPELADKESREVEILKAYLPPALSEEELKTLVREAAEAVGARDLSAMGRVMKAVMPKVAGRADGQAVSRVVREQLQGA